MAAQLAVLLLKFEDARDSSQVDALLLAELLRLRKTGDVAQRIAPRATFRTLRYDQAKALGIVDWLWEEKKAGRIRNFGFSCHDNAAGLEHILRDQPWDFCQLQYNYLDTDDRAEEIACLLYTSPSPRDRG